MTTGELKEASAVVRRLLRLLLGTTIDATTRAAADLRRAVGDLSDRAEGKIEGRTTLSGDLSACFRAASAAGATFTGMDRVRAAADAEAPLNWSAVYVAQACARYALVEITRILAVTEFVSREDIDSAGTRLHASFEAAEIVAADQKEVEVYRALVALHAAATRDLTQRSRPLPRMVSYAFTGPRPALYLANRLYGDGGRGEEIIAENKPVHPLFMARQGRALSA